MFEFGGMGAVFCVHTGKLVFGKMTWQHPSKISIRGSHDQQNQRHKLMLAQHAQQIFVACMHIYEASRKISILG